MAVELQPDNVLIGSDGWPRVADFGLARLQSAPSSAVHDLAESTKILTAGPGQPPLSNLTETGTALGTPLYMSPEQHMGETVDSRSDQFGFCVALYEALYQQMPFAGDNLHSLRFNVVSGRVLPRPADSHVPTIIHQAILRGLSTDPSKRFPSMSELLAALAVDIATDASIGPGARREVVVSMVAVTLVAAASITLPGWSGLRPERSSLITAAVLFAFFTFMAVRFRRVIGRNWFHRGMLVYGLVVAVWMLALRGVGFALDLGIAQIMTLDLVAIAATSLMTVATIQPKLWPMIPTAAISAAVTLRRPEWAQYIMPTVLQLGYVTSAVLWYRAAIKHQPTRRALSGPDSLTRSGVGPSTRPSS